MRIIWPLPPDVAEATRLHIPADEAIIIALATDLIAPDKFGEGWLVATAERLLVLMPDKSAWHAQKRLLQHVRSAQVEPLVGGGRLMLRTDTCLEAIIYFSSSLTERFAEAARAIEKLAKKEELRVPDEEPAKRCGKCGRQLPEPGSLCPACVRKVAVVMRIVRYIMPYWPSALLLALIALFSMGARLVSPYLTQLLVEQVLVPGENAHLLIWYTLGLLGMALLEVTAGFTHGWVVAVLSARVTRDIRAHIYRVLERLTLVFTTSAKRAPSCLASPTTPTGLTGSW